MLISDQYCILAINQLNRQSAVINLDQTTSINKGNKLNESESHHFIAASKIVFKELFEYVYFS